MLNIWLNFIFKFAATSFIEFWKRRQAVIAWEWDLTNFEDEEQTRPEYETNVKTTRINPVTRKHEPYLSPWDKAARVLFTNSFVFVMVRHTVILPDWTLEKGHFLIIPPSIARSW